jgi:hypothetical protein
VPSKRIGSISVSNSKTKLKKGKKKPFAFKIGVWTQKPLDLIATIIIYLSWLDLDCAGVVPYLFWH